MRIGRFSQMFLLLVVSGWGTVWAAPEKSVDASILQQSAKITTQGTVVDAQGEPLIGVSILEVGTTNGTITDIDGKFTLQVTSGATLELSYIGYKTQQLKAVSALGTIQMSDDTEVLQEVVVTALGIKREKKALGYAIQEVKGESLVEARETNLANALSGTLANLMTNLGGISIQEQRPDIAASYIKDADYLGKRFEKHFVLNTDNPTKGYWMDGLPENLDPRALKLYYLPYDSNADNTIDIGSEVKKYKGTFGLISFEDETDTIKIDGTYSWNGIPAGTTTSFSPSMSKNELANSSSARLNNYPILGSQARDAKEKMVYFGPWETYFLVAEALERQWVTPGEVGGLTAENAYNKAVELSFIHFGVSQYYSTYITSTDYNRVGTSVAYNHTTPASTVTMKYVDGYTDQEGTVQYQYPDGTRTLYGNQLNDHLSKIFTQKYIAQLPYLVQECWSDYRRVGLPFFDIIANEKMMTGTDMTEWDPESWKSGQKWQYYPQRMRYPTTLDNANPTEYKHALELLGGANTTMVPLWWSLAYSQK